MKIKEKKQVKAIQDNKHLVNINKDDDYKDKLLLSKEREIFKDIYNKRLDKIEELNNEIDYNNLQYVAVNSGKIYNFSELTDPITFLDEIKKGKISLEEAKTYQQNYLDYLNIIRKGNKNPEQKNTLANINVHFNARNNAIKFIEDYGSMILEVIYSVSDIQDNFEYILKKHSESVDNPSIRMYINRIENRIIFKIKNGYYLELLTPETMKLLGSTESKITKDKNGENVPHLEVVELVLVHCSLVNNDYQQDSRILFTFVPNKSFGSLLEISPTNHVFLKTFNSEFQEVKVWFTDQTSKPLELEDKINITLIIK